MPVQLTIPLVQTSHQELISLAESGSPWTTSALESVVSAPTCTAGASAPQQPVWVALLRLGAPLGSFDLPGWKLTFRRVLYSIQCRRSHLQLESVAMVISMGNYLFQNRMHCLKCPLTVALLGIVAFLKLVIQPHALIMKISSSHLGFVNVAMVICLNYCQK